MLKKAKLSIPAIIGSISLIAPALAYANNATGNIIPTELGTVGNLTVVSILQGVIRFILVVAFVLAFIFLLIGGIRWITAGGDEKGVERARGMITAALIGLVVVLIAFALIKLVEAFFGVSIISNGICVPKVGGGCAPNI